MRRLFFNKYIINVKRTGFRFKEEKVDESL